MAGSLLGCTIAPVTFETHKTPDAFNPADWLRRFQDADGWWILGADNKLGFGIPEEDDALAIYAEIKDDPAKRAAIKAHMIATSGEATNG